MNSDAAINSLSGRCVPFVQPDLATYNKSRSIKGGISMNLLVVSQILGGFSSIFGAIGALRRKEWLKSVPYLIGIVTFVLFLLRIHNDKKQRNQ